MDHRAAAQQKYPSQAYAMLSPEFQPQPPPVPQPQPTNGLHTMPMQDMAAEQSRLQESLKRSVTLVFWYKPGCDPIRLHQEIPTFPLFQLSQFSQLVNDLGFSSTSYVDMYNPHSATWEQQNISAVRVVESEQRLLYRVRKSLLEGLTQDECPGVHHEISMQPQLVEQMKSLSTTPRTAVKRPAVDQQVYHDASHPNKYVRMDTGNGPEAVSPTRVDNNAARGGYTQVIPVHIQTPQQDMQHTYAMPHQQQVDPQTQTATLSTNNSPTLVANAPADNGRSPIPYHPHPPLKRWPNDYCVSEIAAGFRQMDNLITQQPSVTQKVAFERVFGCRYIKSTVCRHRAVWKRADPTIKDAFDAMGLDERAVWGDFVKKVEGKLTKDSASRPTPTMQMQPQQTMAHMQGVQTVGMQQHGGLDVNGGVPQVSRRMDDEPAMASLGPPPPGHPGPGSLHPGAVA